MSAAAARRTGQLVWRSSYNRGEREHLIWHPLGDSLREYRRLKGAMLMAAKKLERSTKQPGCRNGALGFTGIAVLEALTEIVDHKTGRLDPMLATIAEKAGVCVRTVVRALKRLSEHGFVDWLRRSLTCADGTAGQTSSAYWFPLRGRAAGLVRLIMRKAPPETRTREEVQAAASAERQAGLRSMRYGKAPPPPLEPELAATLRRRAEERSRLPLGRRANDSGAMNPGGEG